LTKKEIAKLLAVLAASYPKFEVDDLKVHVWHEMLQDIPYDVAQVAVKKIILEKTFAPSIAEFREEVINLTSPSRETNAAEAWWEVKQAIKNYGFYRESEALESLSSEAARKAVQYMGWQELCLSEDPEGVLRAQFMRIYEQVADREKKQAMLSEHLQQAIQAISQKASMQAIPERKGKEGRLFPCL